MAKARKCWDTTNGKNAFDFLILRSIERKYYYYLSVRICKFLFLFVDECVGGLITSKPCKFTLAYMFFPGLGVSCQGCVQDVIFGICMKDEICDSGFFDSIEEVFKEKLAFLDVVGDTIAGWLTKLVNMFIGECK